MIRNEPSNRLDRRIQNAKLRRMWRSLNEEQARLDRIPRGRRGGIACGPVLNTQKPDEEDVTDAFDRAFLTAFIVFILALPFILKAI